MSVADGSKLRVVATFVITNVTRMQNVYHMEHKTGSAQDDADVVDAALEFVEELMDNFTALISSDVSLEEIAVFERVSGAWEPIGSATGAWVGTAAGERVPSGCALMVEMRKLRTGHQDRKFIGGFTDTQQVGDTWVAAVLTAAAAYIVDIVGNFTATNSVILGAVYFNRVTEAIATYVGGAGAAAVSYQRRRKPGVGLT